MTTPMPNNTDATIEEKDVQTKTCDRCHTPVSEFWDHYGAGSKCVDALLSQVARLQGQAEDVRRYKVQFDLLRHIVYGDDDPRTFEGIASAVKDLQSSLQLATERMGAAENKLAEISSLADQLEVSQKDFEGKKEIATRHMDIGSNSGAASAFEACALSIRAILKRNSAWVSIAERMPDHGVNVLICNVAEDDRYGIGYWTGKQWYPLRAVVTHWMQLPQFPTVPNED